MILALFAAVAVSLVTTGAGTGIQEERGTQAFYIADGGLYYTLKRNTYPYYDGDYDPPLSDALVTDIPLGDGNGRFTVTVPTLSSGINSTDNPVGINLSPSTATDGFTAAPDGNYWVLICGVTGSPRPTIRMSSDCEKLNFDTKGPSSFSVTALPSNRGKDSTDAAAHPSNTVVMMYSWDTAKTTTIAARDFAKGAKCKNAPSRICVADTAGFASSGFIRINNASENYIEDVFYYGKCDLGSCPGSNRATVCGSTCTGATAGCLGYDSSDLTASACTRRAFDGGGNGTATHASGTDIYQSEFSVITTSEGRTPGAIILTAIKRVLQTNVLPLKDP